MTGKLEAALAWARRGFRVFPLQVGSKDPLDMAWTLHATTDHAVIRQWWTDPVLGVERDLNVGFLTTDWIVADVDVKKGKPGLETMMRLGLDFDTLAMRTPTGGYHLVYRGLAHPVGQSPLGPGLDVRSHNGYVVAPGSELDVLLGDDEDPLAVVNCKAGDLERRLQNGAWVERRTYEVEIDQPVRDFPGHLRRLLKEPKRRADVVPVDVDLDAPEALELAAHWLQHDAPAAVEGMNGDDTAYKVACRVRDYGVSEAQAVELFLDEYNPRCEPPWSPEEARLKVENAYRYATGAPGGASPAASFGDVVAVAPAPAALEAGVRTAGPSGSLPDYGNMLDEADIPPRAWIVHGLLAAGVVTTLVAPGGVGKSLLSLIVAAHLAVGVDVLGHRMVRPGKSIVYNAEDDLDEVSRRLNAVIAAYGLDRETVKSRIAIWGSDDVDLQVTRGTPPAEDGVVTARLLERCADPDLVMFSVDPLVEVHTGRENDAVDMRYVMGIFRSLARRSGASVLVVQHTGKANPQVSHAGNQDANRGSSAIPAAARIVLTLANAREDECLAIGVPAEDRASYVRLDGAKATALSAKERARTCWLTWVSHRAANGDSVGVLVEHDSAGASAAQTRRVAEALADGFIAGGSGSMTVEQALAICGTLGLDVSKVALARMFAAPVAARGGAVQHVHEAEGGRRVARMVMR